MTSAEDDNFPREGGGMYVQNDLIGEFHSVLSLICHPTSEDIKNQRTNKILRVFVFGVP